MIALFTDFGYEGPYVGQMRAVLWRQAPGVPVVDLMHDAPAFNARAAAYLLPALLTPFPPATVFVCVIDPGVGDPGRQPVVVQVDGHWFVGPDNGLFNVLARRSRQVRWWDITWRPSTLSASFHGRDLFAPVAARLALGEAPPGNERKVSEYSLADWPADLPEVIYLDRFGNAVTGLRAEAVASTARLQLGARQLERARTFSDVPPGTPFWYENSSGLVEIAVNCGRADSALDLAVGTSFLVI